MGYGRQKWHSFFNNWPPSWMCHSDRTGCWTWVSPHRKEAISLISAQFYHMPGRYERVCVGWHCAKVKGHAELKIEKSRAPVSSTRKLISSSSFHRLDMTLAVAEALNPNKPNQPNHSSPNSFVANAHLRQICLKTVKVIERSRDVTPRSKVKKSKGRPWSPCAPIWCNSYHYFRSYGILNKMAHAIFF